MREKKHRRVTEASFVVLRTSMGNVHRCLDIKIKTSGAASNRMGEEGELGNKRVTDEGKKGGQ